MTRFGWVRVRLTEAGLTAFAFTEVTEVTEDLGGLNGGVAGAASLHQRAESAGEGSQKKKMSPELLFREAFCQWVSAFDRLTPEIKWEFLDPVGTDFQKSVWRALLEIPFGTRRSYGQIAADLGRPKSSRAVGSAVAANPIALLVPCHRVLPATGRPGNYRWGSDRKLALLEAERASGSDLLALL